jgi:hypothetical protein
MEMRKRIYILMSMMSFSFMAKAHDEGHGPKLADTGKYGGLVSAVVLKQDAKLGGKADLVHKAELVRSTDGTIRLYLYDSKMQSLDIKNFNTKATGSLAFKMKGKWKNTSFDLQAKDGVFEGKMPKAEAKPYNIDVVLKEGEKELLTAFDNLD